MQLRERVTKQMVRLIRNALDSSAILSTGNGSHLSMRIPEQLQVRIEQVQAKHGFTSYRHALTACIRVGLDVMEATFPVERKPLRRE